MMNRFGKSVVAKLLPNENKKAAQAAAQAIAELELVEKRDLLKLTKTFRYGFPFEPTSIAFDMIQHILAIGNKSGYVKLYGGELIEATILHSNTSAVLFMSFVINEGALITYCEDATISFWNLRQKLPAISHSKKLNERATSFFLPLKNKWLYIGTEKGNIYILNIYSSFSQSGYDIKWNNVIELSQKTHPGKVVHLSEHPLDHSKLLIGFETGLIVLWNVKNKKAESRFLGPNDASLLSISWFFDGKQFISSHSNGALLTWSCKNEGKAVNSICPHYDDTDLIRDYNPINKVAWETRQNGEQLTIFSNGLVKNGQMKDAITILRNCKEKQKTVIEMKSKIIDFIVIESSIWQTDDPPEATSLIVLLKDNLVAIDLKTDGYPTFQIHHSIDIHDSPISFCDYIVDPDLKLIQHLLVSKEKQSNSNASNELPKYSSASYPVFGGIKSSKATLFPYYELIITGHEDGTVKIWEASGICLDQIYKIKTNKIFDKRRCESNNIDIEHPFKISNIAIHSNYMAVAAVGGHITLYKYISKKPNQADDELVDIAPLEIPVQYDYSNDKSHNEIASSPIASNMDLLKKDLKTLLRVKIGCKRQQGYQPELVCLLLWSQKPPTINSLVFDSKSSILLVGTDESIICINYVSRTTILNMSTFDYYGNQDPYQRVIKSPKKSKTISDSFFSSEDYPNDNNNALNFLAKQFTIDNSNFSLQRTMDATLKDNSKSSSNSSLDNSQQNEGVSYIAINEPVTSLNSSKNELSTNSTIWLGTSYGTVILLTINCVVNEFMKDSSNIANSTQNSANNLSSLSENMNSKLISLVPNGVKHFLTGQIIYITFLDNYGNLITPKLQHNNPNTIAGIPSNVNVASNSTTNNGGTSPTDITNTTTTNVNNSNTVSNSYANDDTKITTKKKPLMMSRSGRVESLSDYTDRIQYAVLCSKRQIKVISLPSQSCTFKYDLDDDTTNISKANVAVINNFSYLICLLSNGNILSFNLPSLKPNSNLNLALNQHEKDEIEQIMKTFIFGAKGHSYYMPTPSEIQKLIVSTVNENHNITEMLPELYDPKITTPTAPKPSLFKSIFSSTPLDREQLFGETSGKPSVMIVRPLDNEVAKTTKELSELQKLALQRGEKLGQLEKRTEEMALQASSYAKNASELANKYKKKSQWPF